MITRNMGDELPKLLLLLEAGREELWREIAAAACIDMNTVAEWRAGELRQAAEREWGVCTAEPA